VHTRSGQVGIITSSFGKGGKFKAHFARPDVFELELVEEAGTPSGRGAATVSTDAPSTAIPARALIRPGDPIFLRYWKRLFDPLKDKTRRLQQ